MYEITETQRQEILRVLGEVPSKYSLDLFMFFSRLPKKEEPKIEEKIEE